MCTPFTFYFQFSPHPSQETCESFWLRAILVLELDLKQRDLIRRLYVFLSTSSFTLLVSPILMLNKRGRSIRIFVLVSNTLYLGLMLIDLNRRIDP